MTIQVLIVEDDPEWREGLAEWLCNEPDINVVGAASSGGEATQIAARSSIDIVLLDINLTDEADGISLIPSLDRIGQFQYIMLTSNDDRETIERAFAAGAVNYVVKHYIQDIPEAIRDAYADKVSIHHSVSVALRAGYLRLARNLSDDDLRILRLVEEGRSVQQIAASIHLEEQSVKNKLGKIARKIGFSRFGKHVSEKVKAWGLF
jgi:DNA-binding NarL/FixJ family response regulator